MLGPLCLSLIIFTSAMPIPDEQSELSATSGAEDLLPTPVKEQQDLGNGVQEITLQAMPPLPVSAHGTALSMKGARGTTFMACHTFDIHDLAASHITKFDPIISKKASAPGDRTIVHHIDRFMCDNRAEGIFKREGARCDSFPDGGRRPGSKHGSKEMEDVAPAMSSSTRTIAAPAPSSSPTSTACALAWEHRGTTSSCSATS